MSIFKRKTLRSDRARARRIDMIFGYIGHSLLIVLFVYVITTWFTHREALRIDSVVVEGAHATDGSTMQAIAKEFLNEKILWHIDRDNALFYPKANLSLALLSLDSRIKSVETSVSGQKVLKVAVEEYAPKHLWCRSSEESEEASSTPQEPCYLADEEGYVFAPAPNYSGYPFDRYRTNIAGADEQGTPVGLFMLPQDELQKVFAFIAALEGVGVLVREVEQLDQHDFSFVSDNPWVILWSTTRDPVMSASNLDLVTAEMAKDKKATTTPTSIDLRFGNKVFYK